MTQRTEIGCACGQTQMELEGGPILAATCHCTSCRKAADIFAPLGGPEAKAPDGGTPFVVWRSDKARTTRGAENLREHRLKPDSSTRRVLATCCHAPMYLQFTRGHWLSIYAGRFAEPPPTEMRTMLEDLGPGVSFDDGIPAAKTQSAAFMWRLLKAWAAMGFRSPKPEAMPKLEL